MFLILCLFHSIPSHKKHLTQQIYFANKYKIQNCKHQTPKTSDKPGYTYQEIR